MGHDAMRNNFFLKKENKEGNKIEKLSRVPSSAGSAVSISISPTHGTDKKARHLCTLYKVVTK